MYLSASCLGPDALTVGGVLLRPALHPEEIRNFPIPRSFLRTRCQVGQLNQSQQRLWQEKLIMARHKRLIVVQHNRLTIAQHIKLIDARQQKLTRIDPHGFTF